MELSGDIGPAWPDQPYVAVRGIWLRKLGDQIQVLAEVDDGWRLVIEEHEDGPFSHIVEPAGIKNSPLDLVAKDVDNLRSGDDES